MTDFLNNNSFSVRYSDKRANLSARAIDSDWFDGNACIDTVRNTLFTAGWSFVNPLKIAGGGTMLLGSAVLQTDYHRGQGYMELADTAGPGTALSSLPYYINGNPDYAAVGAIVPLRFLLKSAQGLYQFESGNFATAFLGPGMRLGVRFDGGVDMDLPAGTVLNQIRGLPAYAERWPWSNGNFSGTLYFWMYDRAANNWAETTLPGGNCGQVNDRFGSFILARHESAGIGPFLAGVNSPSAVCSPLAIGRAWQFRQPPQIVFIPDTDGLDRSLDWVAQTGRDSVTGDLNFKADMTGTIGNNAVTFFDFETLAFFTGPQPTASGGGWVMTSPGGEITVIIRQSVDPSSELVGMEFLFADSRSSIVYDSFFYGRPSGAVSYKLWGGLGGRIGHPPQVPDYRIIASSLGFAIIDVLNDPGNARNCLLAVCPRLAQEQLDGGATKSVLIVGPNNLNQGMAWDQTFSVSNDGADFITSTALAFTRAGICTAAFGFNYPLLTSNGRTFLQNAWVMAPPAGRDGPESQILGRVPDCLVLTGDQPQGYRFSFDGHTFICIATQGPGTGVGGRDRPVCSLWMAAD